MAILSGLSNYARVCVNRMGQRAALLFIVDPFGRGHIKETDV